MKFFLVLTLLLLLFDSSKESAISRKRPIRGLNTTLQTNFNSTYQRKNPCTNADIETSSYIACHEFHHHIKEDNWSDYTHKCSAIISSFLQGIGKLIQFNTKQNGTFNFHINTSISQKQDEHYDEKQCESLPTIFIEADSCELPPSCKKFPEEYNNYREQIAAKENKCLPRPGDNLIKEANRNSAKIISKTLTNLKPVENEILNTKNYFTAQSSIQDVIDEPILTPRHVPALNNRLDAEEKLQENQKLIPTNDVSYLIPFSELPRSSQVGIEGTTDPTQRFFNDFSQNIQATEENSEYTRPPTSMRDFITSITIQPEDEFTTAYPEEKTSDFENPPCEGDQQNTFDLDDSKYLTSPATPVTWQDITEESSVTETQNFPYYPPQKFKKILQQPFVNDEEQINNQYQPSKVSEKQILNGEIPDFQVNRAPNLKPSFIPPVTSIFEGDSSQVENIFNNQSPSSLDVGKTNEPDFRQSPNYDEELIPPERFQPAEFSDLETNPNTQTSDFYGNHQFDSEGDKLPLQQQAQYNQDIDDMYINSTPYPIVDQQKEKIPEIIDALKLKKPFLLNPSKTGGFQNYPKQPSSYPLQTTEFKEYDEPNTKPPQVENVFPNAKPTLIPPMTRYPGLPETPLYSPQATEFEEYDEPILKSPEAENLFRSENQMSSIKSSKPPAFRDYDPEEYIKPTIPIADYSDQLPAKPLPFSEVSLEEPTNSDFFYAPEADQETEIPYSGYYDRSTPDPSGPLEQNYKLERPYESFTERPFSQSNNEPSPNNIMTSNINLSANSYSDDRVTSLFDPTTPSFDDSEDLTSFQSEIRSPDSSVDIPETEQQFINFREPSTYVEKTTQPKYDSSPKSEFYDDELELEFTEISPSQSSSTTPSLEYLATPPSNQISSPSEIFSDTSDSQDSYENQSVAYSNDFQPKPRPIKTPFYAKPDRSPNLKSFSDDYVTVLPDDSFLPKFKENTVNYPEKSFSEVGPNRNLDLRYTTLSSDTINSDRYKTNQDSFSKQKEQSSNDFYVPATRESFLPLENFPESITKNPSEPTATPTEKPSFFSDVYIGNSSPKVSGTDLFEETLDDFYPPGINEPYENKKTSPEQSFEELSIDKSIDMFTTLSPPESFEVFDSLSSDEQLQDVLNSSEPESISLTPDEVVFNKNESPSPYSLKSNPSFMEAQPFFNVETTPDYKFSEFTEPVTSNEFEKSEQFSVPTAQNSRAQPEEFEYPTTPLPPATYPEDDYYPSGNPSTFPIPPAFDESQTEAQIEAFEPITYSKASSQASAIVYENQNQPFFNPGQYSSASPASLQKETTAVEQETETPSNFQQPLFNYKKYQSGMSDAEPKFSSSIPGQLPVVSSRSNTFFEPEYESIMRPSPKLKKPDLADFKNPDQEPREIFGGTLLPNTEDYPTDFLPKTKSIETLGFSDSSKSQAHPSLTFSKVQPSDLKSESVILTDPAPTDSQLEEDLPYWSEGPTDLISDPQSLLLSDSSVEDISTASPDNQFILQPSSETLYQHNAHTPSFSSQTGLNSPSQFPSTKFSGQTIRTTDYPTSIEPQLESPLDYDEGYEGYDEGIPDSYKQLSSFPLDTSSISQQQSEKLINTDDVATPSTSFEDYTSADEPFLSDETIPPRAQTSLLKSQEKMSDYSSEPQPQPSYDNFSDIPSASTPLIASNSFENSKLPDQYQETSFQSFLNAQEPLNFRESPKSVFEPSYTQPPDDFDTTPKFLPDTDIPSFQTSPISNLMTNGNERSQENTDAQMSLIFSDKVSPQFQPTPAVNYDEEIETAQYQTSPAPNPKPQTTMNYANRHFYDNLNEKSPGIFTNQQQLITPEPNSYSKVEAASSATSSVSQIADAPTSLPENEMTEELSITSSKNENHRTKEIFEQEISTTDYPIEDTPQPFQDYPNLDSRELFLPYNNQIRSQPIYQKPPSLNKAPLMTDFNEKSFIPPELPADDVNFEKKQEKVSSQITRSEVLNSEHLEPFIPLDEPPSRISDIYKTSAPPNILARPMPEDYRNDFDDYDVSRSPIVPNDDPRTPLNSQIPQERFFYPNRNLNYNSKEFPKFSRPRRPEFPPSFETRSPFIPENQPSDLPNSQIRESITDSHSSSFNKPQIRPSSFASSMDEDLYNKRIAEIYPLSGSLKENKRFEQLDKTRFGPSFTDYKSENFPQSIVNNPQQVEPSFERDYPPNVSYPDHVSKRPAVETPFPDQEYAEYDQTFSNPLASPNLKFGEVISQDSQKVDDGYQFDPRGSDVILKEPHFQEKLFQRPVNHVFDRETSFPPPLIEQQQHSNPLFHTLESHMTIPLQESPPSPMPDESFLLERNYENNFQENSPRSHEWEASNPPSHQQGMIKPEPDSQLVSDLTDPSNNPGEDHVSCCSHCNKGAPLLHPFDPVLKGNMTAPSYYILISKLPVGDNGDEQYQVKKVFLGDGTPLSCSFNPGATFSASLCTPVSFPTTGGVKFQTVA